MAAIFYPDLSHYDLDRGVTVAPGTVAVIAKATHGTLFLDRGYATIRQQALAVGAIFAGYHWLNHGNGAAQADYYYSQAGSTPAMVDAEDMPGNSGFNGYLTVGDICEFVTRLRARGGVCHLCYLPKWYWQQHMGSPDLTPLARLGVGLVSSNYTAYADNGPGWAPYGGMTPVAWQYTDALPYGGSTSDFNAFRGSVADFAALITGKDDDAMKTVLVRAKGRPEVYLSNGIVRWHIPDPATLQDVIGGVNPVLGTLYDNVVHEVDNLAAFGVEYPPPSTTQPTPVAPTQDQIDAAVLKALADPAVAKGIGDAIASHLHVT